MDVKQRKERFQSYSGRAGGDSVLKSTAALAEDPSLVPRTHKVSPQPPIHPLQLSASSTLFWSPRVPGMHTVHIGTHKQSIHYM